MDKQCKETNEDVYRVVSEEMCKDDKIIKDLIVGFLIVKFIVRDGNYHIRAIPLDSSWDGFNGDNYLCPNEEIIGVIPAPQGSYKVLGLIPCERGRVKHSDIGSYEKLGYEYSGAYHPDWEKLLEEMKNRRIRSEE